MTPIVWATCGCWVWPIVPGYRVGRCGYCGSHMVRVVDEPASGRAGPL